MRGGPRSGPSGNYLLVGHLASTKSDFEDVQW